MNTMVALQTLTAAALLFTLPLTAPASAQHAPFEIDMPEWYERLEDPTRQIGDMMVIMYSGQPRELIDRIQDVEAQVATIVSVADIWNIDLDLDGRATRIIQQLRDARWYKPPCTMEDEQRWVVQHPQGVSQDGFERQICICFLNWENAENAIRRLDIEEGFTTSLGPDFWDELERRTRENMFRGVQAGQSMLDNEGLRQDLENFSRREQRPYQILTLDSTGETIELWIRGNSQCNASVNVLWTNIPATR